MMSRLLKYTPLASIIHRRFFSTLLLFISLCAPAQQYNFRDFVQELAQPYVYSLVQDNNGYLWIGTGNGLSRYNGFVFETFTTNDSLADNFITCSFKSDAGVWFGHMNGKVSYFDGETFTPVNALNQRSVITDIEQSPDGEIWASTVTNGLVKLSDKSGVYQADSAGNQIVVFSFQFITENEILVGSVDGLFCCKLQKSGELEILYQVNEIPRAKIQDIIRAGNDNGFFVATENEGIFQVIPEDDKLKVFQVCTELNIDFTGVQSIFEDDGSNIWISTFGNGLIKVNSAFGDHPDEVTFFNKSTGFPTNHVKVVYEDREGNIWCGNYGAGLTLLTEKALSFYSFDEAHYGNKIYSVFVWGNSRWLGTNKGLLKMNHATGEIIEFYSSGMGLPQGKITSIYGYNDNELWIGTENNGVYRMDADKEKFTSFEIGTGLLENSINDITGRDDEIWISTKKGACNINITSEKIQWFTIDKGGLPHNYVNHIFIDAKGKVWISTLSNSIAFIQDGTVGEIMITSEKGVLSLGNISEEDDSTIWVGSNGSGIFRIRSGITTNLTTREGLLSDYCYSVTTDHNKNIWVGHRGGLSKIRTSDLFVRPIQQCYGVESLCEFNANAVFEDVNNRILFGSSEGLLIYDPSMEKQMLLPPALSITSVKVNDNKVDYHHGIVLKPGIYKIDIEYLGINLKEPSLVNYKYQLSNFDDSPEYTRSNKITYSHLGAGNYTFILSAVNGDGVKTVNPLTIEIVIKNPVWKHWWFYVILILGLGLTALLLIVNRERKYLFERNQLETMVRERTHELAQKNSLLHKKQEEITSQNTELEKYRNYLEVLVDERTRELLRAKDKAEESDRLKSAFLKNISHEIRTPLNAICGFSRLLEDDYLPKETKLQYIEIMNNNADSLLYLIDEILDMALIETDQMVFSNECFGVDNILSDLEKHYKITNNKEIKFEYVNKGQKTRMEICTDKTRFRQIFVNLLNNAYKFTESGFIKFGYELQGKKARFFVSDTGIGISESEIDNIFTSFYKVEDDHYKIYRGAGIGLSTYKKIVELMGGEIWVESVVDKGSVFNFTLPVSVKSSEPDSDNLNNEFTKNFLRNIPVIVAEDDPVTCEMINSVLNSSGAVMTWAKTANEVFSLIENSSEFGNAIVLMDIEMSLPGGKNINRKIKFINNKLPIIGLTAYTQMDEVMKEENMYFDGYISKPISERDMLTKIAECIKKCR